MSILTTGGVIKSIRGVIGGVIYSMVTPTTAVVRTKKPKSKKGPNPIKIYSVAWIWRNLSSSNRNTWNIAAKLSTTMPGKYKSGYGLFCWWFFWSNNTGLHYPAAYPSSIPSNPAITASITSADIGSTALDIQFSAIMPANSLYLFTLKCNVLAVGFHFIQTINPYYFIVTCAGTNNLTLSTQFLRLIQQLHPSPGDLLYVYNKVVFSDGGTFNGMYDMPPIPVYTLT